MEIFLLGCGLLASFFFAGSESAFTAFNKIRLDIWRRHNKRFISPANYFYNEPDDFFSTILIGNNLANTLYTTFATVMLVQYLDETLAWLVITLVILFLGEILPKTLFRALSNRVVLPVSALVYVFFWFFKPLIRSLNIFIDLLLRALHIRHQTMRDYFSKEELFLLLNKGHTREDTRKYIKNILQFKDVKVREAMLPRTQLVAVSETSSWDEIYDKFLQSTETFILLYSGSIDNITKVLFPQDLLEAQLDVTLLGRGVTYVPINKSCAQLLQEFQLENTTLAVVLDEYGGTAGVITMDDLIEEMFGEVELPGQIVPLNDRSWLIDARVEIDLLNDLLHLSIESRDAETVAGFILEQTGSIPKAGQSVDFDGFRIEIKRATNKRIQQVKLSRISL